MHVNFDFNPKMLCIAGKMCVNVFGTMVAIGLAVFFWATTRDPRFRRLPRTLNFSTLVYHGTLWGIVTGRLLYVLTNLSYFAAKPLEVFAVWDGGLSLLGPLVGVPIILIYELGKLSVPIMPFFDLILTYVPIISAISRIGCFLAGCCHGSVAPPNAVFSVTYIHTNSLAPLGLPLIPMQIYSAIASFFIFMFLYMISKTNYPAGLISSFFFALEGLSRFLTDFWRGDRDNIIIFKYKASIISLGVSWYQVLALTIALLGLGGVVYAISRKSKAH